MSYLLLDIGATSTKIGITKNLNKIGKFFVYNTPQKYREFLSFIKDFKDKERYKGIVIGFAGLVKESKILKAPNIPDFDGRNIVLDLKKIFGVDVILKNDAELAGLGEAYFGNGRKFKLFGYITFSSGIGGVKISNKKIEDNFWGFEPGHTLFGIFNSNFYPSAKLDFVEIEKIIGGKSIEKIYGKKPEEIKDKSFWKFVNKVFSAFLVNVALFWSVEAIIIGGSMIKSLDFDELKVNFENFKTMPIKVKLLKSKLKEKSALYGGLAFLKNKNFL